MLRARGVPPRGGRGRAGRRGRAARQRRGRARGREGAGGGKAELRAHEGRVAEWERKVAGAEEAQKVAAEAFKKGQKDIQMFKEQCARLEEEAKAAKAAQAAAEKRATEARAAVPL